MHEQLGDFLRASDADAFMKIHGQRMIGPFQTTNGRLRPSRGWTLVLSE
jgi:hypothetical protein